MRIRTRGRTVNDVLLINNSGVQGLPGDEGTWTAVGDGPNDPHQGEPRHARPRSRTMRAPRRAVAADAAQARGQPADTNRPRKPASPDGPWTSPVKPAVARRLTHEMADGSTVGSRRNKEFTDEPTIYLCCRDASIALGDDLRRWAQLAVAARSPGGSRPWSFRHRRPAAPPHGRRAPDPGSANSTVRPAPITTSKAATTT